MRFGGRALWLAMVLALAGFGTGAWATVARAEGCANEQLRSRQGPALGLPDCRAYEQVSPVAKNFTDALGEVDVVQSSPSGDGVTFFSHAPFPGVLSATGPSLYLGTRNGGEWSTQGLVPQVASRSLPEQGAASVLSLTEDLSAAIVNTEPGLEVGMGTGRYSYLRDNATGAFRLLGSGVVVFADATAGDSRIIFESSEQLLPGAASNAVNLYEWADGQLSVVGILPTAEGSKVPAGGSVAGPGGSALGGPVGGATDGFYTQDTISTDGSRIFFSDVGTGRIYLREPGAARTIRVSGGLEPAHWRAATADGSEVFYTEGENLYRFDVAGETREALTSGAAGVLGMLGISTENGSYAYFVATDVLAGNENGNKESAEAEGDNLYEWHDGKTSFIAKLSAEGSDRYDWRDFYRANSNAPAHGAKSSRVTPDGTTVLFSSQAQLTGYDNAGVGELYLYDAKRGTLTCASCNPSGTPATSEAYFADNPSTLAAPERNAFLTRNLSDDGTRVFFQTREALVSEDTNEQTDVYEWEREGVGGADGCQRSSASFSESSGGCLYLISTGQSGYQSYFGEASTDGSDVFFFTRQSLVGQDQDQNDDLYDARVEGGIAAQSPSPAVGCAGEGCLGPVASSSPWNPLLSTTLAGDGNQAPPPTVKAKALTRAQELARALKACAKQRAKRRGACRARARRRFGRRLTRAARGRRALPGRRR